MVLGVALMLAKRRSRGEQPTALSEVRNTPSRGDAVSFVNPARFVGSIFVVRFPFQGHASDELTCLSGERLRVVRVVDNNWVLATNWCGAQGIVPLQNLRLDVEPRNDPRNEPRDEPRDEPRNEPRNETRNETRNLAYYQGRGVESLNSSIF